MFQFRRFPTYDYFIHHRLTDLHLPGCPIRKSPDIALAYSSPRLIAVNRVLHRLPVPRHSPCALCSLTFFHVRLSSVHNTSLFRDRLVLASARLTRGASNFFSAPDKPASPSARVLPPRTLKSKLCDSLNLRYLSFCHSLDNCINYP